MKSEVYNNKAGTYDELFARIFDAVARVTKGENQRKQQAIFAHE